MNILVISDRYPKFGAGGAGTVAHRLAQTYRGKGHDVRVATTRGAVTDGSSSSERIKTEVDGITVVAFPTIADQRLRYYYTIYNPWILKPFRRWLHSNGDWVDAVHVHNVHEFFSYHTLRVVKQLTEARTVHTYHDTMSFSFGKLSHFVDSDASCDGDIESDQYQLGIVDQLKQAQKRYNPLRNPFARRYLDRYVDASVSISHELAEALEANNVPVTDVIHNGIDPSQYTSANPDEFRARYEDIDEQFVLFAGRASDKKGGLQLAKAIDASHSRPQLVVTGDREEYARTLRERVPGLADNIRALGWVDRSLMPSAYAAATVATTPSIYLDPFILVNIEAMAAGTPVITTCYGGAKEVVKDGQTGFIVNPFDTTDFAEKIDYMMSDDGKRESFGKMAKQHVQEVFSIDAASEEYLSYLSLE